MKHFVLLSILIFSNLLITAKDACDSLMIFLDDKLVLVDDTVLCINKEPFKLMGFINNENLTVSVFLDIEDRKEVFTILDEDYTYFIGVFDKDQDELICTKKLAISVIKPSAISFINAENITLNEPLNVCVQEFYPIIPKVNDTSDLICQWKLNDEIISDYCSLEFNNNNASISKLKLSIEDTLGCIIYYDSLTVNTVSPPTFTSLTPTNSPSCNLDGMISFEVNNTATDFDVNYIFNNQTPEPIDLSNITSFPVSIGSNYPLYILYDQLESCFTDTTFSIISPDVFSVEFDLPKTSYCVGDTLLVYFDKNDTITSKNWYLNDNIQYNFNGKDTLKLMISESFIGDLDIRLEYTYNDISNGTCMSTLQESIRVYPKPNPQITASHTLSICQSEILKLSVIDSLYTDFVWTVNNRALSDSTSTLYLANFPSNQSQNYSIEVTDNNGCIENSLTTSIYVNDGVNIISPNEVMKQDTLCYGTKVLYAKSTNLVLSTDTNSLFRNADLSIVEWKTTGIFAYNSSCDSVEITLTGDKAPIGKISPFNGSNTFVFSDADNSVPFLKYKWFYINLNDNVEDYNQLRNAEGIKATERIIDCGDSDFNCLFEINENKVLGLEINDTRNGCKNLIFYDEHNLFPGLKDISVGVSEFNLNNTFTLNPNPNQGSFYIHLTTLQTNQLNINIYNTLGKLIWTDKLLKQTTQKIEIPNTEAGMYFAVLKNDKGIVAQHKFMIH